jgi:hypothetical protein
VGGIRARRSQAEVRAGLLGVASCVCTGQLRLERAPACSARELRLRRSLLRGKPVCSASRARAFARKLVDVDGRKPGSLDRPRRVEGPGRGALDAEDQVPEGPRGRLEDSLTRANHPATAGAPALISVPSRHVSSSATTTGFRLMGQIRRRMLGQPLRRRVAPGGAEGGASPSPRLAGSEGGAPSPASAPGQRGSRLAVGLGSHAAMVAPHRWPRLPCS